MQLPSNNLKRSLRAGETQIGLWSSLCSPICAEIVAHSGFDWVLLDMEHAPNDIPTILSQLQAMATSATNLVVRPSWKDIVMIKRVLDIGAPSILLPYIQSAEEARQMVEYARYPNGGKHAGGMRGVAGSTRASYHGRISNYANVANDQICILLQVETIEAIEQLEEIAQVEGVDGIFIGPADLSASMGHLGNPEHDEVQAVIKQAAQTLEKVGTASGILAIGRKIGERYLNWGYKFVAVGNDGSLLTEASDSLCRHFKN